MTNTCSKEECPFWEKYENKCPMYMTTVWENSEQPGATQIVEDCAPKRNTLLLMEYSSRAIGMQQDYEQQRNKYDELINTLAVIITQMEDLGNNKKLIG